MDQDEQKGKKKKKIEIIQILAVFDGASCNSGRRLVFSSWQAL